MRRAARILACGLLPLAAPAAGDLAFVTNQNDSSLSIIDLDGGAELDRVTLPGGPAGVAVSAAAVYTVSPEAKTVRRLSLAGDTLAEVVLDGGPAGIVLDTARGRVFVTDWYGARIWVLDATDLAVRDTLATGAAPAGLALSPDGTTLASADRDADQVSLFDAQTLAVRSRLDVGARPYGLAFAPDGRLLVANVGSNDVTVIADGAVTATWPVGDHPYGVAFAAGRAFVTNQYGGTVTALDLETGQTLATIPTGEYPEGIDTTSDDRLVVATWFDNAVDVIDPVTLKVTATIPTGDGPRAFGRFILED